MENQITKKKIRLVKSCVKVIPFLLVALVYVHVAIIAHEKNVGRTVMRQRIETLKQEYSPENFESEGRFKLNYYVVFKHRVYCWKLGVNSMERDRMVLVKGADPKTFQVVHFLLPYGKDSRYVYNGYEPLKGVDPASFVIVSDRYNKDKNHVYSYGEIVVNADPATFQVINDSYAKDFDSVFYRFPTIPLPNADPATFVVIDDFYSKDDYHVYYQVSIIEGADPKTFEVHPRIKLYSKDKNNFFYQGSKFIENPPHSVYPPITKE